MNAEARPSVRSGLKYGVVTCTLEYQDRWRVDTAHENLKTARPTAPTTTLHTHFPSFLLTVRALRSTHYVRGGRQLAVREHFSCA